MEADHLPEIFCPFSKVLQHQLIDIPTSGTEQPNDIGCSVVPAMRDSPIPGSEIAANDKCPLVRGSFRESDDVVEQLSWGFSRKSGDLVRYRHVAPSFRLDVGLSIRRKNWSKTVLVQGCASAFEIGGDIPGSNQPPTRPGAGRKTVEMDCRRTSKRASKV